MKEILTVRLGRLRNDAHCEYMTGFDEKSDRQPQKSGIRFENLADGTFCGNGCKKNSHRM
jgi:hypothetical protein